MNTTTTAIATFFVTLTVTTFSAADPVITAIGTDIGGGLYAWDVFFDGNDGENLAAAIDLKFSGDIHQVPGPFGFAQLDLDDVELLSLAALNPPGPDLVNDSYLFSRSSASAGLPVENGGAATWGFDLPTGIDNPNGRAGGPAGTNVSGEPMWMTSGTSAGFFTEVIQIAHIVIDTTVGDSLATLTVTGRIFRFNFRNDDLETIFQIPEPSTFLMLGMGVVPVIVIGRRRRRAG